MALISSRAEGFETRPAWQRAAMEAESWERIVTRSAGVVVAIFATPPKARKMNKRK